MKKLILYKLGMLIKITQSTRKFIVLMDDKDPDFEQKVGKVMGEYNKKCEELANE